MTKVCKWCGKKLQFLDASFDLIEIDNEDYYICGQCNGKLSDFKSGHVRLEDIVMENTDKILYRHMEQYAPDSEVFKENELQKEREQAVKIEKKQAQQTNPLYDDIHQIAGDLRFLKNVVIIMIVLYVIGILFIGFKLI